MLSRYRLSIMKCSTSVVVALAGVVTVASGCNNQMPIARADPTGTIVGQYRVAGGPAPGINRPEPGTIWAYAGRIDMSQLMRAESIGHVQTDSTGKFTLRLKPGEYTLLGAQGSGGTVKTIGCG